MVEEVSADELHERLDAGEDVQVIDVRPERAFQRGRIPGAENVPLSRFARSVADRTWSDDIVVVCPHGISSLQAARLLEAYEGVAEGARVANLSEGYEEWPYDLERE